MAGRYRKVEGDQGLGHNTRALALEYNTSKYPHFTLPIKIRMRHTQRTTVLRAISKRIPSPASEHGISLGRVRVVANDGNIRSGLAHTCLRGSINWLTSYIHLPICLTDIRH